MESETVESLVALIELRPTDAELYQRLGRLHFESGRMEEARAAYKRSLELDPNDAWTQLLMGNWFYSSERYVEALVWFQRAAGLMPDEPVVYWCQGDVHRERGQYELAQVAFEKAARIAPDNETARKKLAAWRDFRDGTTNDTRRLVRTACRNDQAAITVLLAERWLKAHPNDFGVTIDYAEMLYQMARYDEAIRIYLDLIERFEDARWGLYNKLGHLHHYRGDFAVAELWYQKAVDEDPDEVASRVFLGAVQARQGKLTQAEETHRRATQCPEGPVDEAYHNLGLVLRGQGRLTEAAEAFRKAIELFPEYPDAIEALQDVKSALALSTKEES